MRRNKARLSRHQFEQLILGEWIDRRDEETGRSFRQNGKFKTEVDKQWKIVSDGKHALRAKTWYEIAKTLELV